ncbi:hypothetical protein SECTIM467_108 [Brevibacillus phage SecTim467]|uniref:Lipoprotein n=2 Tax=Jenstvirus jenst TaxID=1982225 RepID=A0A0K2CNZ8_9CAUD|nr:hypothetical protein AVV11_gp088 [Brevibacillus phage Jenst]ALA07232.1 hypothetical protein JENST_103 [Brevibacillus phage Jenst]ALA07448.1 hypothetical protein SECTIM467_108 [Brevibacillus phage SecTim467]
MRKLLVPLILAALMLTGCAEESETVKEEGLEKLHVIAKKRFMTVYRMSVDGCDYILVERNNGSSVAITKTDITCKPSK